MVERRCAEEIGSRRDSNLLEGKMRGEERRGEYVGAQFERRIDIGLFSYLLFLYLGRLFSLASFVRSGRED